MTYTEDEFLQLSGIQHFAFCKRQWALIHIEQVWEDDSRTVEGTIFHENADDPEFIEKRCEKTIRRSVKVASFELGLSGTCDVTEFYTEGENLVRIIPIEYKVGRKKNGCYDEMQLCAEAMALEEMYRIQIKVGYLYYGLERSRTKVDLDNELREKTIALSKEMHEVFSKGTVPIETYGTKCKRCSLFNLCLPNKTKSISVKKYIQNIIKEE